MADPSPVSDFCNRPCSVSRATESHMASKFAEAGYRSAGMDNPPKILDELWGGHWKCGLAMLKKSKGVDPLCDKLESICQKIADLESLETVLWEHYKLSGPLDHVALRQHCEESIRPEMSFDAKDDRKQKHEWLQSLDRLHRLRKEKGDILTQLTQKYGPYLGMHEETPKRPNIWAVLIGINEYKGISPLRGAVRDVAMVKQYLESDLSVPPSHIKCLTDAAATRAVILSTLYDHLRDNPEIQRGDAIIIHYSGHGASYSAQESFNKTVGSIEAICPVDRGVGGDDREPVLDISDREINLFLTELSNTKGDNITLVLDCSFSAPVPRCSVPDPGPNIFLTRETVPLASSLHKMLLAAEKNARKRWPAGSALTEDWTPDVSSYVVLAACQDFESAWECSGDKGGDFTIALLKALRSLPLYTSTYRDLTDRIGSLRRQQPFAVGDYVDNFVFNHKLGPQYDVARFAPRAPEGNGKFVDVHHHQESTLVQLVRWVLGWLRW